MKQFLAILVGIVLSVSVALLPSDAQQGGAASGDKAEEMRGKPTLGEVGTRA